MERVIIFVKLDTDGNPTEIWQLIEGVWVKQEDSDYLYWTVAFTLNFKPIQDGTGYAWSNKFGFAKKFGFEVDAFGDPGDPPGESETLDILSLFDLFIDGLDEDEEETTDEVDLAFVYQEQQN